MYILSKCDSLIITARSTYGRCAAELAGVYPTAVTPTGDCVDLDEKSGEGIPNFAGWGCPGVVYPPKNAIIKPMQPTPRVEQPPPQQQPARPPAQPQFQIHGLPR